jgi:hypothetical protein
MRTVSSATWNEPQPDFSEREEVENFFSYQIIHRELCLKRHTKPIDDI